MCEIVDCIAPDCAPGEPCPLTCMVVGECVEKEGPEGCQSDADCGPGEMCELVDSCMPMPIPLPCTDEDGNGDCDCDEPQTDCMPYGICVPKTQPECLSDADCPADHYCELVDSCMPMPYPLPCLDENGDGECEEPGTDCAPYGICVPKPVSECDSDADCPKGHSCLMACALEACPPGEYDCPADCFGECVPDKPECSSDYECGMGMACIDGECLPINDFCFDDSDCPDGFYCDFSQDVYCADSKGGEAEPMYCGGICVPDETCKGIECPPGMELDPVSCKCVEVPMYCFEDDECPDGFFCDFETGEWCGGATPDGDDYDALWCGGICVPEKLCLGVACPEGTELDATNCTCVPVANPCVISGCSGQICASEPMASTCEWEPYYECFGSAYTSCGPFGPNGSCMWEPTADFFECLNLYF